MTAITVLTALAVLLTLSGTLQHDAYETAMIKVRIAQEKERLKRVRFEEWKSGVPEQAEYVRIKYGKPVMLASKEHRISPKVVIAVIVTESGGRKCAVSNKKAVGLMQLRPIAAKEVGTDVKGLCHPDKNIAAGTAYLKRLRTHHRFKRLDEILLAYNRGPVEAAELLGNGYAPEQDEYVRKVKFVMAQLK
ncbi:MAG: lytic transglycosylase domain-containing protein [Parcubacteria group bacterium]|nr:lytic transglycosylase domain-containing protein [Parcubacteria group bacterium]